MVRGPAANGRRFDVASGAVRRTGHAAVMRVRQGEMAERFERDRFARSRVGPARPYRTAVVLDGVHLRSRAWNGIVPLADRVRGRLKGDCLLTLTSQYFPA